MSKRQNNAIWKIQNRWTLTPRELRDHVLNQYEKRKKDEPNRFAPLQEVKLNDISQNRGLSLYIRIRPSKGMLPFVESIIDISDNEKTFGYVSKDTCLFLETDKNLYVVTSGSGYHIIQDFVDYSYPFDVAKKLIANSFKSAQKRKMTGLEFSVDEKYRRDITIDKRKNLDSIWKSLVGKIDVNLLPGDNFLREIIDLEKPPTAEVKSSFTLKKSLSLQEVIRLISSLENLPDPSPEHKKEMDFLDCLQPVKKPTLKKELDAELRSLLLSALRDGTKLDFDVCDPDDLSRYSAGSNFKIGKTMLDSDESPTIDTVIGAIGEELKEAVEDDELFAKKLSNLRFTYDEAEDGISQSFQLTKMFHGQINFKDDTYFLIDKNWYYGQGDYLSNLVDDFIECVFSSPNPLLVETIDGVKLIEWKSNWDEDAFNKAQSKNDGFYYGDKINLQRGYGKIELFDLLYVNEDTKQVYLLHVKDDFDAKMRDVCSQVENSRDVITQSKQLIQDFKNYYASWSKNSVNACISEDAFLKWMDSAQYEHTFIIVCSTPHDFTEEVFAQNRKLQSYVAKREIIVSKQEFRGKDVPLRIMHTKKVDKDD